jgi:hypothetical protein
MRHVDDLDGKRDRSRVRKVRFPQARRPLTSGVVIRAFTPGETPPAVLSPLELLALAPIGSTVELAE